MVLVMTSFLLSSSVSGILVRLIRKTSRNLSIKVLTLFDGRCHEVVDILGVCACKVI